jgi:hypothetical protein
VTPHTVTTDRGTFAVLDNRSAVDEPRGSAVLVPGFTGSKEDFIAVLAPLAARGVHALALDLAGQYESTRPDDTVYSLGGFAADVWSVTHQLAGIGNDALAPGAGEQVTHQHRPAQMRPSPGVIPALPVLDLHATLALLTLVGRVAKFRLQCDEVRLEQIHYDASFSAARNRS